MAGTNTYGWRAPNLGDPADGPGGILRLGQDIENTFKDTAIQQYTPILTSDGDSQPSGLATRAGYYRVDNGVCHLNIRMTFGPGTFGGTGYLYVNAPLPPNPNMPRQDLTCHLYIPAAAGGIYMGFGYLTSVNGNSIFTFFPLSAGEARMGQFRNATNGNATGTSTPTVASNWAMLNGGEVVWSGSYFL